jgi:hypothetical protein
MARSRATALESPEDLLAIIRSGDPEMRLKLKSEIRKRISRIEVSFGLDGFEAVADVKFIDGVQRGIILDGERVLLLFRLGGLSYLPFRSPAVLFLPLSPTAKPRRRSDEANSDHERDPHRQDVIKYTQGFLPPRIYAHQWLGEGSFGRNAKTLFQAKTPRYRLTTISSLFVGLSP